MEKKRELSGDSDSMRSFLQIKDEHCEAEVLGSIIRNTLSHEECRNFVNEDCFTVPDYKAIYSAFEALDLRGENIDLVSLNQELRKRGYDNLFPLISELIMNAGYGDISNKAKHLRELSVRRSWWKSLYLRLEQCADLYEDIGEIITATSEDANNLLKGFSNQSCVTLFDADTALLRQIESNMNEDGELTGSPTGFKRLDAKGGLQPGTLTIIAAETSQGKTSLALAMAKNCIEREGKIAFYSMEMTMNEISARIVAMKSGISSSCLLYAKLQPTDLERVMPHCNQQFKHQFFLDDNSTSSLDKIIASIRALKIKYGIDGAFIDYLQMLNVNIKVANKEQAMGEAARRLKNLAKELNIWIVALSQLNRNHDNPVPTLNRLRDSGQIAEAADTVMLIYRPEYYNRSYPEPFENKETKGTAMIDVAKGRNTGVFKFLVQFDAPTTHFQDFTMDFIPEKVNDEPF